MNWEAASAVAELIGAIAIIVSLIYLTTQIRQNTKSIQTANYGTWIEAAGSANALVANSANHLEDALQGNRPLGSAEEWTFRLHMMQLLNGFEAIYLFHLHKTIDTPFFESKMRGARKMLIMPGVSSFWDDWSDVYDPRFVKYLNG